MAYNKHILAALDEKQASMLFESFISSFDLVVPVDAQSGRVRLVGDIKFDIPDGKIEFESAGGGFVRLDELDVRTDLNLTLQITTPEVAIPRACVNVPCNGRVCTPKIVLVPSTTIPLPLNLPPIRSEVSGDGMIVPVHDIPNGMWQLKLQLNPLTADIDLIDIADTLADWFESIMSSILDSLFGNTLGDVIYAVIGEPVEWLLRTVLDVADDLSEWFRRLLSDTLHLHTLFSDFLEMLTGAIILAEFADRQKFFPAESPSADFPAGLPAVRIAIEDVLVDITSDKELVVGADVGSP